MAVVGVLLGEHDQLGIEVANMRHYVHCFSSWDYQIYNKNTIVKGGFARAHGLGRYSPSWHGKAQWKEYRHGWPLSSQGV